jgi:hypothetical protein
MSYMALALIGCISTFPLFSTVAYEIGHAARVPPAWSIRSQAKRGGTIEIVGVALCRHTVSASCFGLGGSSTALTVIASIA